MARSAQVPQMAIPGPWARGRARVSPAQQNAYADWRWAWWDGSWMAQPPLTVAVAVLPAAARMARHRLVY